MGLRSAIRAFTPTNFDSIKLTGSHQVYSAYIGHFQLHNIVW